MGEVNSSCKLPEHDCMVQASVKQFFFLWFRVLIMFILAYFIKCVTLCTKNKCAQILALDFCGVAAGLSFSFGSGAGNLIRLSFIAAKPLMPGFVLELSDLTFGLQLFVSSFLPRVLLQELSDEALGQLARVAEELVVEVVVHRRDVPQRFLLRVAEER